VASGAGSPRQEEGEVAREEGNNGEEVKRWRTLRQRVARVAAGGGHCAGGERPEQRRSREAGGVPEEGEGTQESEGLVCNSQKVQGPLCKLKFLTDTKS
jgi:hypothetical protein